MSSLWERKIFLRKCLGGKSRLYYAVKWNEFIHAFVFVHRNMWALMFGALISFPSDICQCSAGDRAGRSRGSGSTRNHVRNTRQPSQRIWSRISYRPPDLLLSCREARSHADASFRGTQIFICLATFWLLYISQRKGFD